MELVISNPSKLFLTKLSPKMTTELSIIIPVYNAVAYINRCIDSIISAMKFAKLTQEEVEIIVVDDCSTDMTSNLLEELKKNIVPNLVIIRHKINRQQGAARNTGLRAANGKYVWFVDVDDLIEEEILKQIKSPLLDSQPDIFQFHAIKLDINGNYLKEPYIEHSVGPMTGKEFMEFEATYGNSNRIRASWSKWFRRNYLLNNEIYFQEGVYWEDVMHTLKSLFLADKVIYEPVSGYIYIQTPNSDMRGKQNGKKYADTIRFCAQSCEFLVKHNASEEIKDSMKPYYNKVLRKYKQNIGNLSEAELSIFCNILNDIDLTYISLFFYCDEHSWLLDADSIKTIWTTSHEN